METQELQETQTQGIHFCGDLDYEEILQYDRGFRTQEILKEDKERLQEVINKFSPQDIADLLDSLYQFDKALSCLIEDGQKIAEEQNKIRQQELINLANKDKMEFVLKGINEMTDKYVKVERNNANIREEREL